MTKSLDQESLDKNPARHFAVVIGINHYPLIDADLENAHADAQAVRDWLVNEASVPKANVKLVQSKNVRNKPTPLNDQIDGAFEEVFEGAQQVAGDRRLYIYFAGHGTSQQQRHVALLTAGFSPNYLGRSLDTELYHDALSRRDLFRQQIIFYDCCRNRDWSISGRGPEWASEKGVTPASALVEQWILYAAGFTQFANARQMIYSTRRGLFTRALLEGLRGEAARREGEEETVSMLSLADYISARLMQLTQEENLGSQILSWNPAGMYGNPVLMRRPVPSPTTAAPRQKTFRVHVLAGSPAATIVLHDGRFQVIRTVPVIDGEAVITVPPGTYILQAVPPPEIAVSPFQALAVTGAPRTDDHPLTVSF